MGVGIEGQTDARIGAYVLGEVVARGGMGVVYRATHVHLGREVALKLLAPELSGNDEFRRRFLRESRLAASLDHPNVITVYDAGDFNGTLYIAMRYIEGVDLAHLLREQGPLDPLAALSLLDQVAAALDAAHEHGLIHRDVKPGNVMIASGQCYLTDFGLTKEAEATAASASLTKTGALLGTLAYAAPEQIEGREITASTDVYALGCVLHECLTGAPPFTKESEAALLYAHLGEPPPRASELRPELPGAIDDVVAKALAKSPQQRYRTCGELMAAVRAAVAEETEPRVAEKPRAPATEAAEQPTTATVAAEPATAVGRHQARAQDWTGTLRLVVGALVVAAVAVVLALVLTGGRSTHSVKQDVASLNAIVELFITGKQLSHIEHQYSAAAQNRRQVLKQLDAFKAPQELRAAAQTLRQMTTYSLEFNQFMARGQTAAAKAPDEAHNALRRQFVAQFNSYAQRFLGLSYTVDDF